LQQNIRQGETDSVMRRQRGPVSGRQTDTVVRRQTEVRRNKDSTIARTVVRRNRYCSVETDRHWVQRETDTIMRRQTDSVVRRHMHRCCATETDRYSGANRDWRILYCGDRQFFQRKDRQTLYVAKTDRYFRAETARYSNSQTDGYCNAKKHILWCGDIQVQSEKRKFTEQDRCALFLKSGKGKVHVHNIMRKNFLWYIRIWHLITSTFPNTYKDNITTFYRAYTYIVQTGWAKECIQYNVNLYIFI
jgi:hypothetical protein